jgi:spermidine/putrescine-binding protein
MFKRSLIAAAATLFVAAPATAQLNAQGGLVNVTIQDVSILNNFLNGAQVAALNDLAVPVTVQVPIGVAAAVCDVNANILAAQKKTGAPACDAKSGSKALAQNVIKQKLSQKM